MSAGNFLYTEARAYKQGTVALTTSASVITYTAKTGQDSDAFMIDRVIRVTTASTYSMTITVPDGIAYGQELTVIFEVEGGTETITTTPTTGDSGTSLTGAGGYNNFQWHGPTLGWALISSSAT